MTIPSTIKKLVITGILPVVLAACNTPAPAEENPVPTSAVMPETTSTPETTLEESGVREIEVEAGSFYFNPNTITVKKGETVRIILNSVSMQHDFVIDELNVKSEVIPAGESTTVEFTADTVGEFEYYCSVGQHRAQGMVGTLIVQE